MHVHMRHNGFWICFGLFVRSGIKGLRAARYKDTVSLVAPFFYFIWPQVTWRAQYFYYRLPIGGIVRIDLWKTRSHFQVYRSTQCYSRLLGIKRKTFEITPVAKMSGGYRQCAIGLIDNGV